MKAKKYIVAPGRVKSISDNDIHYITAGQLIRLYRVNPAECVIYEPEQGKTLQGFTQEYLDEMQWLSPRNSGDYTLAPTEQGDK